MPVTLPLPLPLMSQIFLFDRILYEDLHNTLHRVGLSTNLMTEEMNEKKYFESSKRRR